MIGHGGTHRHNMAQIGIEFFFKNILFFDRIDMIYGIIYHEAHEGHEGKG